VDRDAAFDCFVKKYDVDNRTDWGTAGICLQAAFTKEDDWAKDAMTEIYRSFFLNESPILCAGRRTMELTKYGANAFLATKIIFINLIADLCEKLALTFRKFLVISALITVLDQSLCMPGQNMAAAASPMTCWPL